MKAERRRRMLVPSVLLPLTWPRPLSAVLGMFITQPQLRSLSADRSIVTNPRNCW